MIQELALHVANLRCKLVKEGKKSLTKDKYGLFCSEGKLIEEDVSGLELELSLLDNLDLFENINYNKLLNRDYSDICVEKPKEHITVLESCGIRYVYRGETSSELGETEHFVLQLPQMLTPRHKYYLKTGPTTYSLYIGGDDGSPILISNGGNINNYEKISESLIGLINGINKTFISSYAFHAESVEIFVNGVKMRLINDYSIIDNTIEFSNAPVIGDSLEIVYFKL